MSTLGLALSGGGFRASFFHIGVLARLADADLLRHVEVLSTVSGGSIVGALYYIKLKVLLENKPDRDITAADYRNVVARLAADFTAAVETNPRLATFVDPVKNVRMRRPDYSRSDRAGELFDELFYRPVLGGDRARPVRMRDLLIQPAGEARPFHPETHNHRRRAKVPIILINATSLNTGRNWRFEAIRMGEPPPLDSRAADLDRRVRFVRPPAYARMIPAQQHISLGHAVAASAAVPGVFHPLSISRLYPRARVELVDGGVHDNQGVQGLLDRGCTQLIISDGSSQMEGQRHPATTALNVLLRSQSVMMSRIREEQILGADCRRGVEALCFMHLRKGLPAEEVPYLDDRGRVQGGSARPKDHQTKGRKTRYGVSPDVQEAISRLRTDLDAFNQIESYTLMQNGYAITESELKTVPGIWARRGEVQRSTWMFGVVAPLMAAPTRAYLKVLRVGASRAFKLFALVPSAAVIAGGAVGITAVLSMWRYWDFLTQPMRLPTVVPSRIIVFIALFGIGAALLPSVREGLDKVPGIRRFFERLQKPLRWLWRLSFRGVPSAIMAVFISLYLKVLNPLFLRAGSLQWVSRAQSRRGIIRSGPGQPRVP